jgi:GDPmannose 4,6-dehydratase
MPRRYDLKKALILGVTGQDGSYLAEYLLGQGYEVHGLKRRSSSINTERIDHIYGHPHDDVGKIHLHYGDVLDSGSLNRLMREIQPDECYNLAAQSHVGVSFEIPEYTLEVNALGAISVLEAIKSASMHTKLYNAASSEIFGNSIQDGLLDENSKMLPVSPYAAAKLCAFNITRIYRDAFKIFAVSGILFNHESPRRGETFVTRKIVKGLISIFHSGKGTLYLGNLDSKRDWGHARDYVRAMHLMMQQQTPRDYVVATGITHSVRYFIEEVCKVLGEEVDWQGSGLHEALYSVRLKRKILAIDSRYFRPIEVNFLKGDSSRIKKDLGWTPEIDFELLVREMVDAERSWIESTFRKK